MTPYDTPFAVLAAAQCPPYDEMVMAIELEFRAVRLEAFEQRLDDLAFPLFGLADAPVDERAIELARAAWAALPDEGEAPADWMLDTALARGRGAAALRAVLAVELGRRAGVVARPERLHGCWGVHAADRTSRVAAEVGPQASVERLVAATGARCAHQLAFVVLTGLAAAWRSAGCDAKARRASQLRLELPLDERLRELVERQVRANGDST